MTQFRYRFTLIIVLAALVLLAPQECHAQRKSPRKEKREQLKSVNKENSNKEEKKRQLSESRKHHLQIQDKKTRKRMKRTRKTSMIHAGKKRLPFYKRWFRRK